MHPVHGLRCVIYWYETRRYIILESDDIDICSIFKTLSSDHDNDILPNRGSQSDRNTVDYQFVRQALKSMDSEHDRRIVKLILAKSVSRDDLYALGIKPDPILKQLQKSTYMFQELSNSLIAAEDMIQVRMTSKINKLSEQVNKIDEKLQSGALSDLRQRDLNAKKEILIETIEGNRNLLERSDRYSKQKVKQMVKRLSNQLIKENRIRSRSLGAGANTLLDSEDEVFVANAIETKSSAHGRRHDTVLYLNHRVKSVDLLSIANYTLMKRGKKLIKSARTVHLRARPRKINTIEGRKHKGHWLFCTKKPPKTEDHETELTHHQRAHVKLNRQDMFGKDSLLSSTSLDISFDDKAYIRPGTDVGMRDTKAGVILQVSDETKQRKLPQHDFATPEVYQTLSSFRVMTRKSENIGDEDKMIKDFDQSCVTVRPKHFVGSSGCVWASDLIRLRYEQPGIFEMKSKSETSEQLRRLCAIIHDCTFYFVDLTTEEDILSLLTGNPSFKQYEETKASKLDKKLKSALPELLKIRPEQTELIELVETVLSSVERVCNNLQNVELEYVEDEMNQLLTFCNALLTKLYSLNLPPLKSIIAEYTDAGPGVGVSNVAARFRFAEMSRIQNTDRRVCIHRASGDSAQNEAERTNSAIGDALVDGATLQWDHLKPFDGLSEQELHNLSSTDIETLKAEVMERNAWAVAEQVCIRIDDARGPAGNYMKAYVTENPDEHFFWNGHYLKQYNDASKSGRGNMPGHGYFTKIFEFMSSHIETGELYMEYRKNKCSKFGDLCSFCATVPTSDLFGHSIVPPVPRPFPDHSKLPSFHYLPHQNTPIEVDGLERPVDDFQPRVNLKKLFSRGEISSKRQDTISQFSKSFIVPEDLVLKYVLHMGTLKFEREKGQFEAQKKCEGVAGKSYEDYNWQQLFEDNLIEKQTVATLDKYIISNGLTASKYKFNKVQAVKRSIALKLTLPETEKRQNKEELNDIVLQVYESESDSESDNDSTSDINSDSSDSDSSEIHVAVVPVRTENSRRRQSRLPTKFQDYISY